MSLSHIQLTHPSVIVLLVEHIQNLSQMLKAIFARIFTQPEGMNHLYPHATLGVHDFCRLFCRHRQGIEPNRHRAAHLAIVFQLQFLAFLLGLCFAFVGGHPTVYIRLPRLLHQILRFYDLYKACLLIPKITQDVSRRGQQPCRFFTLPLVNQALHHNHTGLLHRNGHTFRQIQLCEQQLQRVQLRGIQRCRRRQQ